jgi:nicotinate phosphoribosyltransferase
MTLRRMYRDSLALLTDLYQLTMASGYFQSGLAEREAVFHLVFRKCPFGGQYAVACGLQSVIEFVEQFALAEDDVDYLRSLTAPGGGPLFDEPFLNYFRQLRLQCDIDAMPEGTVVFAHEPLLRVRGPLIACQLLETVLLNLVNFPTLVATKAARVCYAARGETVLEFGLRRAQGIDGGLAASRAAFVGGCDATSNVLAGKLLGIPVRGTHAHSWVMTFDDETEAFRTYARVMPQNCILLVDTYDTIHGIRNAIRVGQQLKREGRRLAGLRLDSGDLAELSKQARRMLDEAGFSDTTIVASSDLDEYEIERLKQRGSAIDVWGVGTRLATAYDQPALGGVYKLSAQRDTQGAWQFKVKLYDDLAKAS